MSPRTTSAQFAAFIWFTAPARNAGNAAEAMLFARKNWRAFLPLAHEGLGRLLLRLAGKGARPASKRRRAGSRWGCGCTSSGRGAQACESEQLFSCN